MRRVYPVSIVCCCERTQDTDNSPYGWVICRSPMLVKFFDLAISFTSLLARQAQLLFLFPELSWSNTRQSSLYVTKPQKAWRFSPLRVLLLESFSSPYKSFWAGCLPLRSSGLSVLRSR